MYSICFDCQNARADRCGKIFDGTPVEGWTATEGMYGGFNVRACPNFIADQKRRQERLSLKEIAAILNCHENTARRKPDAVIVRLLQQKGYTVFIKRSISNRRLFCLVWGRDKERGK